MSTKRTSQLWIMTKAGPWGPFDWKLLREWLALKWLPSDTRVGDGQDGPWQPAQSLEKLWKGTKAIEKRIEDFEEPDLALEKVPLSSALRKRILDLGWPGDVDLLRNYYWGDHLRKTLELLFPNPTRPEFKDPEGPATSANAQDDPITSNQDEALRFFLGNDHGIQTKAQASAKLDEILDDPDNEVRWDEQRSKVPATARQRERLNWWAQKLGRTLPSRLSKPQASRLIEDWLDEHPELEADWYDYQTEREDAAMEVEVTAGNVDDWREFHDCKKVSQAKVKAVLAVIGSRNPDEPIDRFMNRFFAELKRIDPALFVRGGSRRTASANPGKGGCLVLFVGLVLVLITFSALASRLLLFQR